MTESELIEKAKSISEDTINQLLKTDPLQAAALMVARRD